MSEALRITLYVGLGLGALNILLRAMTNGELTIQGIYEGIGVAVGVLPIPGAVDMLGKVGRDHLPIFDSAEDRVALAVGAVLVIGAILSGVWGSFSRALTEE